jgi:hypothetical protein
MHNSQTPSATAMHHCSVLVQQDSKATAAPYTAPALQLALIHLTPLQRCVNKPQAAQVLTTNRTGTKAQQQLTR